MNEQDDNLTVREHDTIRAVLQCLQSNRHGMVAVVDQRQRMVGTLTDGDCRRALLKGLTLDAPARDAMHRNFIAVDQSFSNEQIRLLMRTNGIAQVPVVDGEKHLVRMISERSLRETGVRPNVALILAGGKGTRMGPLTRHRPKPMLPVAGKPMIEHIVTQLSEVGIKHIFIAINYLGQLIKEHFGDGRKWGCQIEYLEESEELGTGGPLRFLRGRTDLPILVTNGDIITTINFPAFLEFHQRGGYALTLALSNYSLQIPYGVVSLNEDGTVSGLIEKPRQSVLINAGMYVVEPALITQIPETGPFPMTDLISRTLDEKKRIGGFPIHEVWDDVGIPNEFVRAQTLLEEE